MKIIFGMLLAFSFNVLAKETLSDVHKKHRSLRHEEQKKWDEKIEKCKTSFPKRYDSKSPDYDAYFKCSEGVEDDKAIFKAKLDEEICQKFQVSCKGDAKK
jgi:hypothetical protein